MEQLEIYIVKDCVGKYYPNKKYRGSGWAKDLKDARILLNLSAARTVVTQISNEYPNEPPPVILRMTATVTEEMHEIERVKKAKQKILSAKEAQRILDAQQRLKNAREQMKRAEREMEEAKRNLDYQV